MDKSTLEIMLAKANNSIADPSRLTERNTNGYEQGRFTLFHSAMSFCSQKVRATLVQKGAAFKSCDMVIIGNRMASSGKLIPAENYHPDYVRLRLIGGKLLSTDLAANYTGVSSVSTQGFDACAVPTLVDLFTGEVIVDSLRICLHVDRTVSNSPSLVPNDPLLLAQMKAQLDAVDNTPHPALLYGFHPEDDRRPQILQELMLSVYDDKVEALQGLAADNSADHELVAAYHAKIKKEKGGKNVSRDPSFQHAARSRAREIIVQLDRDLQANGAEWLCGTTVTLADLFWGVSLVRLEYLGLGSLWDDLPTVRTYFSNVAELPSIQQEAIESTLMSMPPSKHLRSA